MSAYADFGTNFDCVVCLDVGCEHCARVDIEPWPAETFARLGVTDLEQLARDVQAELERRAA